MILLYTLPAELEWESHTTVPNYYWVRFVLSNFWFSLAS
jgi:hypothetical protein